MSKKNSSVILKTAFENHIELQSIFEDFKKKLKVIKRKNFLVAVSGGPDSLALTALAKFYSDETKCKINFVLVNHNIRSNSGSEAQSVKKLLNKHGIFLNILNNSKKIKTNVQSNARDVRYALLKKFCLQKKIKVILTAHNLEDQVETFLIRLSRGSGLEGLSAMKQVSKLDKNIIILRPMLDYKKDQLINISKIIFKKFFKDPANNNKKYLRTKIRELKKPLEKSGINYPQIIKSIKNLASSRETLDFFFRKIYLEITKKNKKQVMINFKKFDNLNVEMQMRILRHCVKDLTKMYYFPRSKKILNLINRLKLGRDKKLSLYQCHVFRQKNYLIVEKG